MLIPRGVETATLCSESLVQSSYHGHYVQIDKLQIISISIHLYNNVCVNFNVNLMKSFVCFVFVCYVFA